MRRDFRFAAAGLVAALLIPAAATAQLLGPNLAPPPAPLPGAESSTVMPVPQQPVDDRVAFNSTERWIIPQYFALVREKQKRAARSKRYDRALPAGIAIDPGRGDTLPLALLPGLDRLPGPLLRDLPPNRPQTDRVVVGKNVLMVNTASGEVLDILQNILF